MRRLVAALSSVAASIVLLLGCNAILGINPPNVVAEDAGTTSPVVDGESAADSAVPAPPAGDAGVDAAGPCKVVPQSGCPTGQTCSPVDATTTRCVPAGTSPEGHPCTNDGTCAPGLLCYDGACHKPCTNLGQRCTATAGTLCVTFPYDRDAGGPRLNGAPIDAGTLGVCRIACDPISTTECGGVPAGNGPVASCQQLDEEDSTDCRVAARVNSDFCLYLPDDPELSCITGYVCTTGAVQPCRRLCTIGTLCPSGDFCGATADSWFLRGEEVSFCPPD